nr:hypothetical protein [Tanacetum cinerariifolium]
MGEVEIIRLKERVKVLEDKDGVIGDKYGDDTPIKGRSNNEGEARAERIRNDSEDIARVLTSMDTATVLAREANIPTGSGFIPIAGPPTTIVSTGSEVGPTASPIRRRKGKEILKSNKREREDMRMNEKIAKDAGVARIHAEEEIQAMIDSLDKSNETVAKYLQEYQQFASDLSLEKKIELISDLVKYQEHYKKRDNLSSLESAPTFAELFETNELKAQIQEKDTVILKLKEKIKSLRADDKEINLKSVEVADLNASLQEKVLVITALKEQLKGKAVLPKAVSLNPIDPALLQVDVVPLIPKLRKKRTAHIDYLKHTLEEAATLRELVESERLLSPLNTPLAYACKYTRRIQELLMILQQTCPRITDLGTKPVAVC